MILSAPNESNVECRDRRCAGCVSAFYRRLASPENDCDASEIVYQYVNEPRRGNVYFSSHTCLFYNLFW